MEQKKKLDQPCYREGTKSDACVDKMTLASIDNIVPSLFVI